MAVWLSNSPTGGVVEEVAGCDGRSCVGYGIFVGGGDGCSGDAGGVNVFEKTSGG